MPLACSRRHLGGSEPMHRARQFSQLFLDGIFEERPAPPAWFHWSFLFLVNLAALWWARSSILGFVLQSSRVRTANKSEKERASRVGCKITTVQALHDTSVFQTVLALSFSLRLTWLWLSGSFLEALYFCLRFCKALFLRVDGRCFWLCDLRVIAFSSRQRTCCKFQKCFKQSCKNDCFNEATPFESEQIVKLPSFFASVCLRFGKAQQN